jgi:hypothetical protein
MGIRGCFLEVERKWCEAEGLPSSVDEIKSVSLWRDWLVMQTSKFTITFIMKWKSEE